MSRSNPVKPESKSKLLRNAYFGLFEQDNEGFKDFEDYYDSKMDKLITHFRNLKKKKK